MVVRIFLIVLFFLIFLLHVIIYSDELVSDTTSNVLSESVSDSNSSAQEIEKIASDSLHNEPDTLKSVQNDYSDSLKVDDDTLKIAYDSTGIVLDSLVDVALIDSTEKILDSTLAFVDSVKADTLIQLDSTHLAESDSLVGEIEKEYDFSRTVSDSIEQLYLIGKSERCPSDMVLVSDTVYRFEIMGKRYFVDYIEFCIDRFEYPNLRGRFPEVGVTQYEAIKKCTYRGKRLCSDKEWITACRTGTERTRYAYGDDYDEDKCNSASRMGERSGEYVDCRSEHGVFDMSGNVWEWTSGGGVGAYGGSYRDRRRTRCDTWKSYGIGYKGETVGFRCCKDPDHE